MRPKDWFKLIGGMLLVFVIGMVLARGIHMGRQSVKEFAIASIADGSPGVTSELNIPVEGLPFRMAGKPVGHLVDLVVNRSHGDRVESYDYTIVLDDGVKVSDFADCELTPVDPGKIDANSDFRCLTDADPEFATLKRFGDITFLPSHQVHRLMVPESFADLVSNSHQGSVVMHADSNGRFSLTVNGKNIVDISGNEAGGSVVVRDASGKVVVDIKGDAKGGKVKVDAKGTGGN